ncbi:nuclear transport factor 2 family protein [Streptomyces kronopolitis]|uniref:nuclear transport factor 2 family protein n=1 Tax=Streptomyces TaxID=1883 RepID=UPI0024A5A356|nr:nuclear transport factor 2 family protein [Streptomyces sp. NBRC 13847]GLW18525.1 hypothetical protein Stsp01_52680 [Streptomyces sp. NBRC 13847]
MTISAGRLSHPAVRALVTALNNHDERAFFDALTADATMSDDGADRDLREWCDREVFATRGHLDVRSESDHGLSLVADYRNDTWGEMRTRWKFTVADGKVSRFETGQA